MDRPAPLSGGLLKRTHFSKTRRALEDVLVPRIGHRAFPACQLGQYELRRTAYSLVVWVRASKHKINLVLRKECRRVCSSPASERGLPGKGNDQLAQAAHRVLTFPFIYKNPFLAAKTNGRPGGFLPLRI